MRRVLRSDGTLWLNYGDAYCAGAARTAKPTYRPELVSGSGKGIGCTSWGHRDASMGADTRGSGLKPKDLMMMPARVAMALQADGWWLRSEIIWHKPNPMPESCRDRPTSAHEKMFLLSKSARYFYDAEAVKVPQSQGTLDRFGNGRAPRKPSVKEGGSARKTNAFDLATPESILSNGANLRNVWSIATHSFSEAHFATFPPKLVEPCIQSGTSAEGVCGECGAPWVREVEILDPKGRLGASYHDHDDDLGRGQRGVPDAGGAPVRETTGWQPSCECDAEVVPATALDPFAGSGTVGLVADRLQRDAVLIEISPEYAEMARRRIENDAGLFGQVDGGVATDGPPPIPPERKQDGHGRRHAGFNARWKAGEILR